ncbi:hypothetical protein ACFOEZ_01080 [Tianweitania populi]|uniref:Uncharacterized protein n=1 Tax=Tianweitania populi TaxID=1607949 RepID=A0A8J3GHV9_9HYPH|nr:hypothetical protein [Tianweitania populi]GHD04993.1 hypothetical protein GCM10016234_00290 [Tianweitania populi]
MHDTDLVPEFFKKSAASLVGDYLPDDAELMTGMPFFEGAINSDIAA